LTINWYIWVSRWWPENCQRLFI